MENIFIPFFSTRKNGNGIGLTLCKQIMILHQGSIQVRSKVDMGTSFALHFG
jgi:signal transduction histidine kinase